MTKKEAIKVLRTESIELDGSVPSVCRFWEALDMAIAALREQEGKDTNVPTNADRIRAMSDEELAEFLFNGDVEYCHAGMCKAGETCRICCLKWLQQPAGEEDKHETD